MHTQFWWENLFENIDLVHDNVKTDHKDSGCEVGRQMTLAPNRGLSCKICNTDHNTVLRSSSLYLQYSSCLLFFLCFHSYIYFFILLCLFSGQLRFFFVCNRNVPYRIYSRKKILLYPNDGASMFIRKYLQHCTCQRGPESEFSPP